MQVKEESLDLSEEEWEWVRGQKQQIIDFLLRLEAARERLNFLLAHRATEKFGFVFCVGCNAPVKMGSKLDSRHSRRPADWLAAVRKERMGK